MKTQTLRVKYIFVFSILLLLKHIRNFIILSTGLRVLYRNNSIFARIMNKMRRLVDNNDHSKE